MSPDDHRTALYSLANLALLLPPCPFETAGFDAEIDALVFDLYGLNGLEN
ncbi:MAG TPA: hypothetical protein VMM17_08715 [Gemmatimonadaceae bacterium]|nr:hypothetical protein [Gemmatimonadaceae bacterium]